MPRRTYDGKKGRRRPQPPAHDFRWLLHEIQNLRSRRQDRTR